MAPFRLIPPVPRFNIFEKSCGNADGRGKIVPLERNIDLPAIEIRKRNPVGRGNNGSVQRAAKHEPGRNYHVDKLKRKTRPFRNLRPHDQVSPRQGPEFHRGSPVKKCGTHKLGPPKAEQTGGGYRVGRSNAGSPIGVSSGSRNASRVNGPRTPMNRQCRSVSGAGGAACRSPQPQNPTRPSAPFETPCRICQSEMTLPIKYNAENGRSAGSSASIVNPPPRNPESRTSDN